MRFRIAADLKCTRTPIKQRALVAVRFARVANFSTEQHPLMIDGTPQFMGDNLEQVLLGSRGCRGAGKTQARGDAKHVGIDRNALDDTKRIIEHDIGRFSAHAWQGCELIHRAGDAAVKIRNDFLRAFDDVAGLGFVKSQSVDNLGDFCDGRCGHVRGCWPALKQSGGHQVDGLIGRLCR